MLNSTFIGASPNPNPVLPWEEWYDTYRLPKFLVAFESYDNGRQFLKNCACVNYTNPSTHGCNMELENGVNFYCQAVHCGVKQCLLVVMGLNRASAPRRLLAPGVVYC